VGTGVATSVLEVARALGRELGKEIEPQVVEQYRAGDIRHCFADVRAADEVLGFRAEIPFEQGLRTLLDWIEPRSAVDAVDAAHAALLARGLAR
jgi:dTDP-L-rhamnose 4-epimerase